MTLKRELLEILVCVKCHGALREIEEPEGIVCDRCRLFFPIKSSIPVMMLDEARPLDEIESRLA